MKLSHFDAEKIEVDYKTLRTVLGGAVASKMSSINKRLNKMHSQDTHTVAFEAKQIAEEAEGLKHAADLYHAVCEAPSRETFIVTGMEEGDEA